MGVNIQIKEIFAEEAELFAEIIRKSFAAQAEVLGLTEKSCPNYVAFETAERVKHRINSGEHLYIMSISGNAAGTVGHMQMKDDSSKGYISRLAVLPEFRGKGYGNVLMDFAEGKLAEAGVCVVELSIVKKFERLEQFYRQLGYEFLSDKNFPQLPFEVRFLGKSL